MGSEEIKRVLSIIAPFEGMRIEKHNKLARAKKAGVSDEQRKWLIENGFLKKSLNLTDKGRAAL